MMPSLLLLVRRAYAARLLRMVPRFVRRVLFGPAMEGQLRRRAFKRHYRTLTLQVRARLMGERDPEQRAFLEHVLGRLRQGQPPSATAVIHLVAGRMLA